jgi:predicted transcriptional regulator
MESKRLDGVFAAKWPEEVAQVGFAPIPKCLVTCMGELGLKPQEAAVLCNIIERCWFAGEKSWKKVGTIAEDIGRCSSTITNITASLAEKGFIDKEQRYNTSNLYDPSKTGQRIQEHLPKCRYYGARKLEADNQKSSGLDHQNTSDYIEPELLRTNNIKGSVSIESQIRLVYDFFIKKFNKDPAKYKLSKNRVARIKSRLNDAGPELIKQAIENTAANSFYRGDNERGWEADLDFITRTYEQVERLADMKLSKQDDFKREAEKRRIEASDARWKLHFETHPDELKGYTYDYK